MSEERNKIFFFKKDPKKNLSVFRNCFNIYSSNTYNKKNKENNSSFHSIEPILFEKKLNINENNVKNRFFNRFNNINFNKRKNVYNNSFNPNPSIEEIPTFSYENDINLNSYKQHIDKKNKYIEKNYSNYLNYIKKFDNNSQRKTSLISPYSFYIKKIEAMKKFNNHTSLTSRGNEVNDVKIDVNQNNISINNSNNLINSENINDENNKNNNFYLVKNNSNSTKNINNERIIYKKIEKNIPISRSLKNINYFGKKNEISNPELFFKRGDINYYRYRDEQKRFDDYNYRIILNNNKSRFIKKEPDINPFNPKLEAYKIGESSLKHNIILKPEDFYGYHNNI